jgi:hypothetical protein
MEERRAWLDQAVPTGQSSVSLDKSRLPSKKKKSRRLKKMLRPFAPLLVIAVLGAAYHQGYLAPVVAVSLPALKAAQNRVLVLVEPVAARVGEKVPALAKWLSPIPELQDVSIEDLAELRGAAVASITTPGQKVGLVMSKRGPESPSFYVVANAPDGARVKLMLEGVANTLLNQTSFNLSIPLTLEKKLGRTQPIRALDGSQLPRGSYLVTIFEMAENSPEVREALDVLALPGHATNKPGELHALASKTYFLGGPKDATYASRLQEYHKALGKKAGDEMMEIKAYADHFEKQLTESGERFHFLETGKASPARKKMWAEFHSKWQKSWGQMNDTFSKTTPEALKSEHLYPNLYLMTMQAAQAVERVHDFQNSFVTGGDKSALEIQIGEAKSTASTSVEALKHRIEQIEKAPGSPDGMPVREEQVAEGTGTLEGKR